MWGFDTCVTTYCQFWIWLSDSSATEFPSIHPPPFSTVFRPFFGPPPLYQRLFTSKSQKNVFFKTYKLGENLPGFAWGGCYSPGPGYISHLHFVLQLCGTDPKTAKNTPFWPFLPSFPVDSYYFRVIDVFLAIFDDFWRFLTILAILGVRRPLEADFGPILTDFGHFGGFIISPIMFGSKRGQKRVFLRPFSGFLR
jgi:hypothetical protein